MDNVQDISDLDGVERALEAYSPVRQDAAVVVDLKGFPTAITVENDYLAINCQLATLGEFPEENIPDFAISALDVNSRISPFAVSLITSADDPSLDDESDFVVVLVDHLPLVDLCGEELRNAMDSLLAALLSCREVIACGVNGLASESKPEPQPAA